MSDLDDFRDIWAQASARAWQDPSFKADLLKDPRGALQSGFNYTLPPDLDLRVVDNAHTTTPVVLGNHSATIVLLLANPAAGGVGPVSFGGEESSVRSICVC